MTNLVDVIKRLKKFSLLLFIVPSTAIIFSLIIHNYLVSFKFYPQEYYKTDSFDLPKINCNETNNFCLGLEYLYTPVNDLLDCTKSPVKIIYNYNNNDLELGEFEKIIMTQVIIKKN